MALALDDDAVIIDSGIRLKFLRDAEYDPAPPLVGMDGDVQTLLQCTSDGRLKVDASVTVDHLDIGDVDTKAKDALGVSQYLQVVTDPVLSRYALITNDPRMNFSSGALNVNVVSAAAGAGENKFGSSSMLDGVWHTIVAHTVLAGEKYDISGFQAWGDADAEWRIMVGAAQVGGARTSPSRLMEVVSYPYNIHITGPASVVMQAKHWYASKTINFYASLEGVTY